MRHDCAVFRSSIFGSCLYLVAATGTAWSDVVVAEFFNDRLIRYDEVTGEIIPGWEVAVGSAGLLQPAGVTLDPTGEILFVSSNATSEVLWYNATTGMPLPSPHQGGRNGLFATMPLNPGLPGEQPTPGAPGPLRFGPDGDLYVADNFGQNVRIFSRVDGSFVGDAAGGLFGAGGLTFDRQGALLVGDFGGGAIYRIDQQGQQLLVNFGFGGLQFPSGLLVAPSGDILASDLGGNQIVKYSADGTVAEQFAVIPPEIPDPLPDTATFASNSPSDLALAPDGTLLVAVLGLENPDGGGQELGALLRYDFEENLLQTVLENVSPVAGIAIVPALHTVVGDYDRNGIVDIADYEMWSQQYDQNVALGSGADGTQDGFVTAADYTVWRNGLISALGTGGLVIRIPEPFTAWQALAGLIGYLLVATRAGTSRGAASW